MNYLAHAFLSPADPFIVVGNLVTDMLKGRSRQTIDVRFAQGINLHKVIDYFTDNHPSVNAMKILMVDRFGRYTPVAADIFMDYLLYKNWSKYSDTSFRDYKENLYRQLRLVINFLPQEVSFRLDNMIQHDWLQVYTTCEGINEVFDRMFFRLTQPEILKNGGDWLHDNQNLMENDFRTFFYDIQQYLKNHTF